MAHQTKRQDSFPVVWQQHSNWKRLVFTDMRGALCECLRCSMFHSVAVGDEQPAVHPGECGHSRAALPECDLYSAGSTVLPAHLQHQFQSKSVHFSQLQATGKKTFLQFYMWQSPSDKRPYHCPFLLYYYHYYYRFSCTSLNITLTLWTWQIWKHLYILLYKYVLLYSH